MRIITTIFTYILILSLVSSITASTIILISIFLIIKPAGLDGLNAAYPTILMLAMALIASIIAYIPGYKLTKKVLLLPGLHSSKLSHNQYFIAALLPSVILSYYALVLILSLS